MKKQLLWLMACVVCLTACTPKVGPGPKEEVKEEPKTLTVAYTSEAEREWFETIIEPFTQETGVSVKLVPQVAAATADVYRLNQSALTHFAEQEKIQPVTLNTETFLPQAIAGVTKNKQLYGYPLAVDTYVMYYNKNLLKKEPQTMEELLEMAKAYTNKKEKKYGLLFEVDKYYYVQSFLHALPDETKQPWIEQLKTNVIPLSVEALTYEAKETLFKEGHVLFQLSSVQQKEAYEQFDFPVGVMAMPPFANGEYPTPFLTTEALVINQETKSPKAANAFATFAVTDEMIEQYAVATSKISAKTTVLEKNKQMNQFYEQLTHTVAIPNDEWIDWTAKDQEMSTNWMEK